MGRLAIDVVEPDDIDNLGFSGVNRKNYKRCLSVFFNWAVRNRKTTSNPVSYTKTIPADRGTPEIYTPSEVKQIMYSAQKLHPELVPYLAVAFFAGVRPTEISRLSWSDIDLNLQEIHIRAEHSKTRTARIVHISDNLLAWLMRYRQHNDSLFAFSDTSLKRGRSNVYKAADVRSIQDGARHTFAHSITP